MNIPENSKIWIDNQELLDGVLEYVRGFPEYMVFGTSMKPPCVIFRYTDDNFTRQWEFNEVILREYYEKYKNTEWSPEPDNIQILRRYYESKEQLEDMV